MTFENEAYLVDKEVGGNQFDIVYPSASIQAEAPVAVVDRVVDKKDSRRQAQAYLEFLYSPAGQDIIAQHYLRPRDATVLKKYAAQFKPVKQFTAETIFGSLAKAQQEHFADGGIYDQIVQIK